MLQDAAAGGVVLVQINLGKRVPQHVADGVETDAGVGRQHGFYHAQAVDHLIPAGGNVAGLRQHVLCGRGHAHGDHLAQCFFGAAHQQVLAHIGVQVALRVRHQHHLAAFAQIAAVHVDVLRQLGHLLLAGKAFHVAVYHGLAHPARLRGAAIHIAPEVAGALRFLAFLAEYLLQVGKETIGGVIGVAVHIALVQLARLQAAFQQLQAGDGIVESVLDAVHVYHGRGGRVGAASGGQQQGGGQCDSALVHGYLPKYVAQGGVAGAVAQAVAPGSSKNWPAARP